MGKLGLGTVQFGLDYGATNSSGKTPEAEAHSILDFALESGIRVLDTAQAYGCSEEVLGRWISKARPQAQVVTKVSGSDPSLIKNLVEQSLGRLALEAGTSPLYGVLLHSTQDLLGPHGQEVFRSLKSVQDQGLAQKIGISAYEADEITAVLERFPIEVIQLPFSILDQRLLKGGQLLRLKDAGVEVHARSVFLQGLALKRPEVSRAAAQRGASVMELCLQFALRQPEIDVAVCGVTSLLEAKELVHASRAQVSLAGSESLALNDEMILDPRRWRK